MAGLVQDPYWGIKIVSKLHGKWVHEFIDVKFFLSSIRYLICTHMSRLVNILSPCVLAVQLFDIIVRQWTWENRNLKWFDGIYTGEKIPHIFALNFLLFILLVTTESDCHLYNFLSPLCSVLLISPFYLSFINQAEIPEISDCPDLRQNSLWWTWKLTNSAKCVQRYDISSSQ